MQQSLPSILEIAQAGTFGLKLPSLPANPYVGLRPFNSDEALLFFGRGQQTIELLQQLHRTHFVGIVGSSGCGKSSLVRAGLIPKLQAGFLVEDRDNWLIAKMKPGDAPLDNLAKGLLEAAAESGVLNPSPEVALSETEGLPGFDPEKLGQEQAIYAGNVAALLDNLAPVLESADANLLLLVDQFEELFRFGLESGKAEQRAEATRFVNLLLALTEQRQLPIYVVLTMRSDFLGDCDNFFGLPEALNRSQYLVPRLTSEQLRQAVEGPLHLFGASMSPALLNRILEDVGDQSDQLPVLQHALMRTWEWWGFDEAKRKRDSDGASEAAALPLDLPQYLKAGTIKDALTKDAEAALNSLTADEQKWAERIFRALTATDANNRKIRRPAHISELCAITGAQEKDVRKIIERFRANNRSFLVLSDEADPLVDISHESLIRQWPRLRDIWMKAETEAAELFERLLDAVCDDRELWYGKDLAETLIWQNEQQPNQAWAQRYEIKWRAKQQWSQFCGKDKELLPLTLNFLKQSQEVEQRELAEKEAQKKLEAERQRQEAERQRQEVVRRNRDLWRARIYIGIIFAFFLLALVFAISASNQSRIASKQTRIAKHNEDAALKAIEEAKKQEEDARNQRLRAAQSDYNAQMKTAQEAYEGGNIEYTKDLLREFLPSKGIEFSGAREFVWYYLWKAVTKREQAERTLFQQSSAGRLQPAQSRVWSVAFAPQGKVLAAGNDDGFIEIWDIESGQLINALPTNTTKVFSVAFSKDGKLASANYGGTVTLWDIASGTPLRNWKAHISSVQSVAFSPDGATLASASLDKTIRLWDVTTIESDTKPKAILRGHDGKVVSIAFAPDGKKLASGSSDGKVGLWDLTLIQEDKKPIVKLNGHNGKQVVAVAFSSDGKLASGGDDKSVKLWDVANMQVDAKPQLEFAGTRYGILSLAFSPDGKTLASASFDKTVSLWCVKNGQRIATFADFFEPVYSVAFSPNGQTLAAAGGDVRQKMPYAIRLRFGASENEIPH